MKNSQKGFASIALVVVIIAIIAIGGYFVLNKKTDQSDSQTIVATTDWKTYTNIQYGFEFQYPNKAELYFTDNPFSVSVDGRGVDSLSLAFPSNYFDVTVYKNNAEVERELEKYKTEKTRIVDGKVFNQSLGKGGDLGCNGSYFYKRMEYVYVVAYGEDDCNGEAYEIILSTFKFTI